MAKKKNKKSKQNKKNTKLLSERRRFEQQRKEREVWRIKEKGEYVFNYMYYEHPAVAAPASEQKRWSTTSKEMMELFLRTTNKLGLDYFAYDFPSEIFLRTKTIPVRSNIKLWTVWKNLLGTSEEISDHGEENADPFKWFSELEHLITDRSVFWALIEQVWVNGSYWLKNRHQMFHRYDRMKCSLAQRQEWVEYLMWFKDARTNSLIFDDGYDDWEKVFSNVATEIEVAGEKQEVAIVKRGFQVERGKRIRKGDKGTEQGNEQDEGQGWSYSTSTRIACRLTPIINTYHYKKYIGWEDKDDDEIFDFMKRQGFVREGIYKDNDIYKEGYFSGLGLYTVPTNEILFITSARNEREIVCDPSNATLHDYRFFNIIDVITARLVNSYVDGEVVDNVDGIFEVFRTCVSRIVRRDKTWIEIFLGNPSGNHQKFVKKLEEELKTHFDAEEPLKSGFVRTISRKGEEFQTTVGLFALSMNDGTYKVPYAMPHRIRPQPKSKLRWVDPKKSEEQSA